MDYSTLNTKNFFIKKNSTLPELKYPLLQQVREQYDISEEMLENVAVTFSMVDADTGLYQIANVAANLVVNNDRENFPDEEQYTLVYRFKLSQTARTGRYLANFTIDFLGDECGGKIGLPISGFINVIITDSSTKTTVI